jgi:hypothetical protein
MIPNVMSPKASEIVKYYISNNNSLNITTSLL